MISCHRACLHARTAVLQHDTSCTTLAGALALTQCHTQRSAPILRRNGPTCPDARGNVITMLHVSNSAAATQQGKDAISLRGAQTMQQLPARSGRASAACSWPHRPKRSLQGCAACSGTPEAWLQVVGSYQAVGKVPHRQWAGTAVSRTHAQSEAFCSTALPCHTPSRHQGGWRKALKTGKGASGGHGEHLRVHADLQSCAEILVEPCSGETQESWGRFRAGRASPRRGAACFRGPSQTRDTR